MPRHGEIFGATRLAEHAQALARRHAVADAPRPSWFKRRARGPLLSRLAAIEHTLTVARDTLARASAAGAEVSPAGAWLLDNFAVVLEQVPEIRATLPAGYYSELPKLIGDDAFAGYPRVYEIIIELIAHTDGRLDEPSVALMIREYQHVTALTLGELWAIPAMLRMGYLENIRRMALRAARDVADRELADTWVSRLLDVHDAGDRTEGLSAFVHHGPRLTPAFLTRFLQQIRSRRSDFTPLLWLEQWVAEDVMTVEDAAQRSMQELALTQLVMANSIASLRSVARIDWTAFVEATSATDAVLRGDPSATYADMTRATRDQYRHVVERIARSTGQPEPAIAASAIAAARASANITGPDARQSHVGYHLVGDGRRAFEHGVGYVRSPRAKLSDWGLAHPGRFYFGTLGAGTLLVLTMLVAPIFPALERSHASWLSVALLFALLPAIDVVLAIVHQAVNFFVPPARLPRLDYERIVPKHDRTAVVVPLLLGSVDATAQALEHLEVQYLANRDPQIRFALLSDFLDAETETMPDDDAIVAAAIDGIRALNAAYGGDANGPGDPPFYLLHRRRRWNAVDAIWMGWERKRGKLVDFNAFSRGTGDQAFSVVEGDVAWLRGVRYVITLDADTMLPRGAAAALIGTIAHPLNRAEYDAERGRVVRGYGILQPRVSVSLASASQSRFAAVYSGHPGVDPYTTAVSDVYQDLFGEGSFTGKGIYDVDVFREATDGRFPENSLLSHDLIEGAFARAGLVTDVEVFDDYPTRYLTSTRREHRWIRGDWQLLRWLTSRVPGASGSNLDPLSPLSRWKIADNMRRSLAPVAILAWLIASWTVLPGIVARLDGCRPRGAERTLDRSARLCRRPSAARPELAAVLRGAWPRRIARRRPVDPHRRLPAGPGAAHDATRSFGRSRGCSANGAGCSSGRPRPTPNEPPATAGCRSGGACGRPCCSAPGSWRSSRGTRPPQRRTRRLVDRQCRLDGGVARVAARARVGDRAQCAAHASPARARRRPARDRAAVRASPLAVLRSIRHGGDALAHSRQFPRDARSGRRAAHVADQHRPAVSRHDVRVRSRLSHARRDARATRARVRLAGPDVPRAWASVQLV